MSYFNRAQVLVMFVAFFSLLSFATEDEQQDPKADDIAEVDVDSNSEFDPVADKKYAAFINQYCEESKKDKFSTKCIPLELGATGAYGFKTEVKSLVDGLVDGCNIIDWNTWEEVEDPVRYFIIEFDASRHFCLSRQGKPIQIIYRR